MSFTGPTRVDDNASDVVESSRGVMVLMRKEGLFAAHSRPHRKILRTKGSTLTVDSLQVSEHEAQTGQSLCLCVRFMYMGKSQNSFANSR